MKNFKITTVFLLALSLSGLSYAETPECVITGCNSEICSESPHPHFGICLWKLEYQCYHEFGICEKNAENQCAWAQNPELLQCIEKLEQETAGSNY